MLLTPIKATSFLTNNSGDKKQTIMLDYAVKVTSILSLAFPCVKSNFQVTFKLNMFFVDFLQYLVTKKSLKFLTQDLPS